jgi:hypothetical protein
MRISVAPDTRPFFVIANVFLEMGLSALIMLASRDIAAK